MGYKNLFLLFFGYIPYYFIYLSQIIDNNN